MTNASTIEETQTAVGETVTAMTEETKKPTKKAKKPAAKAEPKAEPKEKPEPVTIKDANGNAYELAEGVDPETIKEQANEANEAFKAINNKEADLLESYLTIGRFQAEAKKMFKSTKLFGQYLKEALPVSQALDPALRSNCTWLHEALNHADHNDADLLHTLGVNQISDFKSANPTVIKREYKKLKKEVEAQAKAQEKGFETPEEMLEAEKAEKEAAEKKEATNFKRKLTKLEKQVKAFLMQQDDPEEMATEAASLVREILETEASDQLAKVDSITG